MGHIGEGLIGPTLIAFGSDAQKKRFLPEIVAGREYWAQGYSEPNAGRSEEHTSELQSLMRISYAVFCLKKKKSHKTNCQILHTTHSLIIIIKIYIIEN